MCWYHRRARRRRKRARGWLVLNKTRTTEPTRSKREKTFGFVSLNALRFFVSSLCSARDDAEGNGETFKRQWCIQLNRIILLLISSEWCAGTLGGDETLCAEPVRGTLFFCVSSSFFSLSETTFGCAYACIRMKAHTRRRWWKKSQNLILWV
jgi:hypothetical protein